MNIQNALNSLLPNPTRKAHLGNAVNQNGAASGSPFDRANVSAEVDAPDSAVNPALMQMLYETRLQFDLQGVEFAKQGRGDVNQALQSLKGTYEEAKQSQVPLSRETEEAVLQALGQSGNGGGGGCGRCGGGSSPNGAIDQSRGDGLSNGRGGGSLGGEAINGGRVDGGGFNGASGGGSINGGNDVSPPANLSADDRQFLDSAISQDPKSFGNLVTSWGQGAEGNCSTVAAIKAAMDRYDNQVFDQVKRTENGYNIVMQDGYKLNLSDAELAAAKKASRFKGQDGPAKSYATFLYGAAAKRNALDNKMTMRQSLNDLNNGESIFSPAKSLGLRHQLVKVNPRTLNGQDSVVAASRKHAIFVDKNSGGGHTADRWGKAMRFNGTDGAGRKIISAYTFKPRSGNSRVHRAKS